tara:strand:+ start:217 stop:390 length:174 start_codon:yes stop_codon:yes gene_type:complete
MENTNQIFDQILTLVDELKVEHVKTTKVAHNKARKIASELKKLSNEYRKASVLENKK